MATKQEIFKEKLEEYLKVDKEGKGRILDAVTAVTGCNRKAAIRRFATLQGRSAAWRKKSGRKRIYGSEMTAALREIWETANCVCAERLHPVIPEYVEVLKRDGMWHHREEATRLLFSASLGTVKNRLASFCRIKRGGGRGSTKPSELKEIIPVRRGPWQNPPSGYGEVDTVAHCGSTISGDFCYTVQYTDVATTWTALSAQWNKGEVETLKSVERIERRLPFPLLGIDPDSGSEFINWNLKEWCDRKAVAMTRTRPYMKNDHARIEQKNYANVRHVVGYSRFDRPSQVRILNELYEALEDYINFFIPSMMCVEKTRSPSARTQRRYDTARTAYRRVLERKDIAPEVKETLEKKYATLNPKILKQKIGLILEKLRKIRPRLR